MITNQCNCGNIGIGIHPYWGEILCEYHLLHSSCFSCDLPAAEDFQLQSDGQKKLALCKRCLVSAIEDSKEANLLSRDIVAKLSGKEFTFPGRTPLVHLSTDLGDNHNVIGSARYSFHPRPGGRTRAVFNQITVLYGVARSHFIEICAHELAHVWLGQRGYHYLPTSIEEGFCDLVAYSVLDATDDLDEVGSYRLHTLLMSTEAETSVGFQQLWTHYAQGGLVRLVANLPTIAR
jgi:hypothetical protein